MGSTLLAGTRPTGHRGSTCQWGCHTPQAHCPASTGLCDPETHCISSLTCIVIMSDSSMSSCVVFMSGGSVSPCVVIMSGGSVSPCVVIMSGGSVSSCVVIMSDGSQTVVCHLV